MHLGNANLEQINWLFKCSVLMLMVQFSLTNNFLLTSVIEVILIAFFLNIVHLFKFLTTVLLCPNILFKFTSLGVITGLIHQPHMLCDKREDLMEELTRKAGIPKKCFYREWIPRKNGEGDIC